MDHLHTLHADDNLRRDSLDADPMKLFANWYKAAEDAGIPLPNTMTLATVTPDNVPAARMVLLKGLDERGFIFFTNLESDKAIDLAANPIAALAFYWNQLARQVRIEGVASKLATDEAEAYFHSRPRGSQIAATVSPQSRPIPNREYLTSRYEALNAETEGSAVPLPPFWGGYLIVPHMIEFWQSGLYRLHDRFRYVKTEDGVWKANRLAP